MMMSSVNIVHCAKLALKLTITSIGVYVVQKQSSRRNGSKNLISDSRYTPPLIRSIFFNHVKQLLTPDSVTIPTNIPPDYQQAIRDQETIDWKQILYGRLAYRWSTIIANHLHRNRIDNREMSPLVWGRRLIRLLFDISLQLWQQRNIDGHLLTPQHESTLTRIRLLQRIVFLQNSNPEIPHHHRDFFISTNGDNRTLFHQQSTIMANHGRKYYQVT